MSAEKLFTAADYPLAEKHPYAPRTPSGLTLDQITLDAVMAGRVQIEDLRVTPEVLEWQAQMAESAGRSQLAENLRRAAELAVIPADKILAIYQALRPGRATREVLYCTADELESCYGAKRCARFVRDAADAMRR